MSASGRSPGVRTFDLDARVRGRTSVLPFLPTLFTALVIAGASFLCHPAAEQAPPATNDAEFVASVTFGHGVETYRVPAQIDPAALGSVPATLAFGQIFPLTTMPQGESPRLATLAKPSRAAAVVRRGCTANRCGEVKRDGTRDMARSVSPPTRYLPDPPTVSSISEPFRDDPQRGDNLPDDILPYLPTAASVLDTARGIGSSAANLGGSVAVTIGGML